MDGDAIVISIEIGVEWIHCEGVCLERTSHSIHVVITKLMNNLSAEETSCRYSLD